MEEPSRLSKWNQLLINFRSFAVTALQVVRVVLWFTQLRAPALEMLVILLNMFSKNTVWRQQTYLRIIKNAELLTIKSRSTRNGERKKKGQILARRLKSIWKSSRRRRSSPILSTRSTTKLKKKEFPSICATLTCIDQTAGLLKFRMRLKSKPNSLGKKRKRKKNGTLLLMNSKPCSKITSKAKLKRIGLCMVQTTKKIDHNNKNQIQEASRPQVRLPQKWIMTSSTPSQTTAKRIFVQRVLEAQPPKN